MIEERMIQKKAYAGYRREWMADEGNKAAYAYGVDQPEAFEAFCCNEYQDETLVKYYLFSVCNYMHPEDPGLEAEEKKAAAYFEDYQEYMIQKSEDPVHTTVVENKVSGMEKYGVVEILGPCERIYFKGFDDYDEAVAYAQTFSDYRA